MARMKLFYDRRFGRLEIREKGSQIPRITLTDEEFADLLEQIFEFIDTHSPNIGRKSKSRWKQAFSSSVRAEAWAWLGGAVKEKITGYFKRK